MLKINDVICLDEKKLKKNFSVCEKVVFLQPQNRKKSCLKR